jgi:hypothetical protein
MRVENVMGRTDESGGGAFAFNGGASGGTDDGYSVSRFKACSAVFSTIFVMYATIEMALLRRNDVNDGAWASVGFAVRLCRVFPMHGYAPLPRRCRNFSLFCAARRELDDSHSECRANCLNSKLTI